MSLIRITAGPFTFTARLETAAAPATCASFRAVLPFHGQLIHARWSGEAVWLPLGDLQFGIASENASHQPQGGDILLYPGGISETEILFAYGSVRFSSVAGPLAGNHFLTVVDGQENLAALGRLVLWNGAQNVRFEELT